MLPETHVAYLPLVLTAELMRLAVRDKLQHDSPNTDGKAHKGQDIGAAFQSCEFKAGEHGKEYNYSRHHIEPEEASLITRPT